LQKMITKLKRCLLKMKYMSDEKLPRADMFSGVAISSEGEE